MERHKVIESPESGKFYVSEGWKVKVSEPTKETIEEMSDWNKPVYEMVLAGPFDTLVEAKKEAAELKKRGYIRPIIWTEDNNINYY